MSLTSTVHREAGPAAVAGTCPDSLLRPIRAAVRRGLGWAKTADLVADVLRAALAPDPDPAAILPAPLRRGHPSGYQSHLLYAEPDGTFSVSAMVWLPGQQTPIHDHVAWCVTAVLQGREHEEIFALDSGGQALTRAARHVNPPGSVSAFAPPGDIHRVRNTGGTVAISMHVYGADISCLGNSIRRKYTVPVLPLQPLSRRCSSGTGHRHLNDFHCGGPGPSNPGCPPRPCNPVGHSALAVRYDINVT